VEIQSCELEGRSIR